METQDKNNRNWNNISNGSKFQNHKEQHRE